MTCTLWCYDKCVFRWCSKLWLFRSCISSTVIDIPFVPQSHGPEYSADHRDSPVAVRFQVVDAPVVQVVPRCCQRQVRKVQALQKTVEVPQLQFLHGFQVAVTRSDKFPAVREEPQTRSSTGCSSAEELRRILRHLSHSVRMDVSAHFSALDGEEFFVVEGSGWRGRRESDSHVFCHLN